MAQCLSITTSHSWLRTGDARRVRQADSVWRAVHEFGPAGVDFVGEQVLNLGYMKAPNGKFCGGPKLKYRDTYRH